MNLIPFSLLFPDIARTETRSLTLLGKAGIPNDEYGLLEAYCPDPACDCQRVMLNVFSRRQQEQVATISYGFDRSAEDAGPYLDPLNPQSTYASGLLEAIGEHLENDTAYVLRLKAHYALVKAAAANPQHPAQVVLRKWLREGERQDARVLRRAEAQLNKRRRRITNKK